MPAMLAQCAVEPEVAMYIYWYWGHPRRQHPRGRLRPGGRRELCPPTENREKLMWNEDGDLAWRRKPCVKGAQTSGSQSFVRRHWLWLCLCGINQNWDHPVLLEGLEEEDGEQTRKPWAKTNKGDHGAWLRKLSTLCARALSVPSHSTLCARV